MKKLVHGVGNNDADYRIVNDGVHCRYYKKWEGMLRRCYSPFYTNRYPSYRDCLVCDEWKTFSVFRDWMIQYESEYDCEIGCHLDKDLLSPSNKLYSPEFCVLIPASVNTFITDCSSARGKYPIGVSYSKSKDKFTATCCDPFIGKQITLGRYNTSLEAHEAWKSRKHDVAVRYSYLQKDPRVSLALRERYKIMHSSKT